MYKHLKELRDYHDLHVAPGKLLATDRLANWDGLRLRCYQPLIGYGEIKAPALDDDTVVIHLSGSVNLSGQLGRRFSGHRPAPGDICIVPRGEPSEWYQRVTSPSNVIHLQLAPLLFARVAREYLDGDPARMALVERLTQADAFVHQMGLAFLSEIESGGLAGRLFVESLSYMLVIHLLRHHARVSVSSPNLTGELPRPALRHVLDYIHEHLDQELTLGEIAAQANFSPYHFSRLFKQSVGEPLHRYIIIQRIERAKQLLLAGQHSIAEVATEVGFSDQSHLYRHFKRMVGVTPNTLIVQRKNVQWQRKNVQ